MTTGIQNRLNETQYWYSKAIVQNRLFESDYPVFKSEYSKMTIQS